MSIQSNDRGRLGKVVVAFLVVTGAVTLATAGVHRAPTTATAPVSGYVPPSMHEAEAGADIGPGSDEALLVTSPMPE